MKISSIIALLALSLGLFSCTFNRDYDLRNKFTGTNTIGGQIQVPIGNSKEINLFRNHGEDTAAFALKTRDNGDFYLRYDFESEVWPFEIPHFEVSPSGNSYELFTQKFAIADNDFGISDPIHFTVSSDFKVSEDGIPKELIEVKEVVGNADFVSRILFDNTPAVISAITLQKGLKLTFPQWCVISDYDEEFFRRLDDHSFESVADLRMTNFSYSSFEFSWSRMDFEKLPQGQGIVKPGTVLIESEIVLDGYFTVSSSDISAKGIKECEIGISVYDKYSNFEVEEVTARIDPGANISIKPLNFTSLEELDAIDMESSVIDITDGFVAMDIFSGVPVDALFSAKVKAYDKYGKQTASIGIPASEGENVTITSRQHSRYCLTEFASQTPQGYTPLHIPGMNAMIRQWPYKICTETVSLAAAKDDFITIKVGENKEQDVLMNSYMEIPLKFGNDLLIRMEDERFEFGFDPGEGLSIEDGELCMDVTNTIPLKIDIELEQVTSRKSDKTGISLLPGTLEKPSCTCVSIPFKSPADTSAIRFRSRDITITCPEGFQDLSLNSSQGIVLENIIVTVHDGISVGK